MVNGSGNGSRESSESCVDVSVYLDADLTRLPVLRGLFGAVYAAVFVVGMAGNLSMLASIYRRRKVFQSRSQSWSVANLFLANLGISDILLCLTAVPLTPVQIMAKRWLFGSFLCRLTPFTQAVSVVIASMSLCCIAVDRYWSIVETSRSRMNVRNAITVLVVLWVVAILVNLPLFLSMRLVPLHTDFNTSHSQRFCGLFCEEEEWSAALRKSYGTSVLFIQFLLPLLIISYSYFTIFRKVKEDMVVEKLDMLRGDQIIRAAKRKRRVTRILLSMVLAFFASWFPITLANIFRDLEVPLGDIWDQQVYLFHLGVHATAMTSAVWNPLLYFWMSQSRRLTRGNFNSSRVPTEFFSKGSSRALDLAVDARNGVVGSPSPALLAEYQKTYVSTSTRSLFNTRRSVPSLLESLNGTQTVSPCTLFPAPMNYHSKLSPVENKPKRIPWNRRPSNF